LVNVYDVAHNENKDRFLQDLAATCSNSKGHVLLGGDFKILRNSDENINCVFGRWSWLFNAIIEQHGLIDLELSNRKFTWSNNRDPYIQKT
jgi:hypothetical protein